MPSRRTWRTAKKRRPGVAGLSIEDATGDPRRPIYDFQQAVEKVAAAAEAARALPFPFMLAGRAENFLHGRPDLDDTIARLKAYAEAGADCLYAPGIKTREQIAAVVAAVALAVGAAPGLGQHTGDRHTGHGTSTERGVRGRPGRTAGRPGRHLR